MTYKPFSKELYKENNQKATEAMESVASSLGWLCKVPDKEQYKSHDVVLVKGSRELKFELEIKKVWTKSGEWQGWSEVDIPHRKRDTKSDYFVMFNKHVDTLLLIKMSDVLQSKVVEKDTIYTKGEKFFRIPVSKFTMLVRNGDYWE